MNNPFTSKRFTNIWLKHFYSAKPAYNFKFIPDVSFVKNSILPYYTNVGKNLTKGISYSVDTAQIDYKGKAFLLYDIPGYFELDDFNNSGRLKLKRVFQYQGFLMNLSGYENTEAYINDRFSGKNRREFRSNKRRLETCFNVSYQFIYGHIERDVYDKLFKQFYDLLSNRFLGKQTNYHHLDSVKWNYYTELVFEMLNNRQASLLVIFKDEIPIGITLNFHSENILFETITVFDPDYYKFSIGKTSIIKLLEWCFENKVTISDFSKGDFEYKRKWSNTVYDFEYHILYDSRSVIAALTANALAAYFKLKLYLRKKHVNQLYRKAIFLIKGRRTKESQHKQRFEFEN